MVLTMERASGSRPPAVLVENGAAPAPSKQLGVFAPLPYPAKSTILLPTGLVGGGASSPGQLVEATGVVPSTSAILPPVAAMAMLPVVSGAGSATPFVVPP